MHRLSLLAISLFLTSLCAEEMENVIFINPFKPAEECCPQKIQSSWVVARRREGAGIGYQKSYTTVEAFFSKFLNSEFQPFVDLRGHVFDNGKLAANAGIGVRKGAGMHSVWGINAFYDYRQVQDHNHFNQIGVGIEGLGTKWDVRLNGYIPFGKTEKSGQFLGFQGNFFLAKMKFIRALTGGDLEIGREVYRDNLFLLHATLGGYYFARQSITKVAGGFFRVGARFNRYLSIEGQTSYDSHFHFRTQGEVAFTLPFGRCVELTECDCIALTERLVEPVARFEMIVTTKRRKTTALTDQKIIFVDNLNSDGNGTFENPYSTLLLAQTNSRPGDIIYVFEGDGTTNNMSNGIILQNDQRLLGSGIAHSIDSLTIPAQTPDDPKITNSAGNGVTLANNNEVSGFDIVFHAGLVNGIKGASIHNANINQNILASNNNAISLTDFSGSLIVTSNLINAATNQMGLFVTLLNSSAANVQINMNMISNAADSGILIQSFNNASLTGSINNNSILNSILQGVRLEFSNASSGLVQIAENALIGNMSGVLILNPAASSVTGSFTIENNLIGQGGGTGVAIFTDSSANQNYEVRNNEIFGFLPGGAGISGSAQGSGTTKFFIDSNNLHDNGNGFLLSSSGSANLSARVDGNFIMDNSSPSQVSSNNSSTLCLRLTNNQSDNGYQLFETAPSVFDLEPLSGNTGTVSETGTITPVPSGFCGVNGPCSTCP